MVRVNPFRVLSTFLVLSWSHTVHCKQCRSIFHCHSEGINICGSNGVTYDNFCHLQKAQCDDESIKFSYFGECADCGRDSCPDTKDLVCGTNSKTYQNLCLLKKARCYDESIGLFHHGYCRVQLYQEDGQCSNGKLPVCGSDGRTYDNLCLLRRSNVEVYHYGPCKIPRRINMPEYVCLEKYAGCQYDYEPVCGDNGHTYISYCLLFRAQCTDKTLQMFDVGHCEETKDYRCLKQYSKCSEIVDPVCGNNGVTYENMCKLRRAQCDVKSLAFHSRGQCPDIARICLQITCDFDYKPVCASDGNTYTNMCILEKAQCRDRSIKFVRGGPCRRDNSKNRQLIHGVKAVPV